MEAHRPETDLGHLQVVDIRPITNIEEIDDRATAALQTLVEELFQLPADSSATEEVGFGRVVTLPKPRERLPREKPLPKREVSQTKWERFAQAKGIQGRKRERFVWDEAHQEWRPRHGGGRARPSLKSNANDWLVEDKEPAPSKQNSFRPAKGRSGVRTRDKQQMASSTGAALHSSRPDRVREAQNRLSDRTRKAKDELDRKLGIVQRSTASQGAHDRALPGERDQRQRMKRSRLEPNTPQEYGAERKRALRLADSVLKEMS
jgi:regulator of ribosome biosynthesis